MTKIQQASASTLKEVIVTLFNSDDENSGIAMDLAINELENRVSETEFVSFLDSIN